MYSETISAKAQQSAVTRKAILDSCRQLFAKHGFSTTSIDDIARAVGITKGAVYWHFTSKKELFEAILEQIRLQWHEVVQQPLSHETSPIARLERLFACYLKLFTEPPDFCLFFQGIFLATAIRFPPQ